MRIIINLFVILSSATTWCQTITFQDLAFKNALLFITSSNTGIYWAKDNIGNFITIDADASGTIEVAETIVVAELFVAQYIATVPPITNISGIEYFTNLRKLNCSGHEISQLDLSSLSNLRELHCVNSNVTTLNVQGLVLLEILRIDENNFNTIDLSGLINLQQLSLRLNQLASLDVSTNVSLEKVDCRENLLTSLNVVGLSNLLELECSQNNLTSLELSGLGNLTFLACHFNNISALETMPLNSIITFYCDNNQLSSLSFSEQTPLRELSCSNNQIYELNIPALPNLEFLQCDFNPITILDFSATPSIESVMAVSCNLTDLNFTDCANLTVFSCAYNNLQTLDLSTCTNLYGFTASHNPWLTSINMKNGSIQSNGFSIWPNPSLASICVDEGYEEFLVTTYLESDFVSADNIMVTNYCSFTPGGSYYIVSGEQILDTDSDGCDSEDASYPYTNFFVTDGYYSHNFISTNPNGYSFLLPPGTHSITPVLENPSYFTISPATLTATFPADLSPYYQNFCITPSGSHDDISVVIIPTVPARPGFDAEYKIILKNKGTTTQSGSLTFDYQDMFLDIVSASPLFSTQVENLLTWNFSNLLPQEIKEFNITTNINSPIEIPAVNGDDQLNFTAAVDLISDEMQFDNTFTLKQIVVNSFDPNDKTCLEGTSISPSMVGEYVHYIVRFENTGTFAAENVVVKDMIDLSKFDISTVVVLGASHPYEARISYDKIEFIFENIMLPFDDATNDGYVAFKIKTLPTLVLGDSFENSASIYFDYNFPIVTDPAVTTIQSLGSPDFEFSKYFTLYPNPASNVLYLKSNSNIAVKSLEIYNVLGMLVLKIPNASNISTIDISQLRSGTYFLKINSENGSTNAKFVRN